MINLMTTEERGETPTAFMELHWTGDRFQEVKFPVTVTRELMIIEAAIKGIAREVWLENNVGRRRVPTGFNDDFNLYLSDIKEGCVNTVLLDDRLEVEEYTLFGAPGYSPLPLPLDPFVEAKSIVFDVLRGTLDPLMAKKYPSLSEILKFGRTLDDSDQVKLIDTKGTGFDPVTFSKSSRKLIRDRYGAEDETIPSSFLGKIYSLENKGEISFQTLDGKILPSVGKIEGEEWDQYHKLFSSDRYSIPVSVEGMMVVGNDQEFKKVHSVDRVSIAYPETWYDRMRSILELEDGWLGNSNGDRISSGVKTFIDALLAHFYRKRMFDEEDRPGIYPHMDGGIQLEWDYKDIGFEIEALNSGSVIVGRYSDSDLQEAKYSRDGNVEFLASQIVSDLLEMYQLENIE